LIGNSCGNIFINIFICIIGAVTALTSLSSARYAHACTLQGNNLIVAGGYNGSYEMSLVEQLDLK
ncbi:MAG: hypothetical protein ACK559_11565, partial [bacterium]